LAVKHNQLSGEFNCFVPLMGAGRQQSAHAADWLSDDSDDHAVDA